MLKNGELKNGDSLPSIRSLASQLDVAVNTVARAYRELENEGILESNGRRGSFIRSDWKTGGKNEIFSSEIRTLFRAGLSREQIMELFLGELKILEAEDE